MLSSRTSNDQITMTNDQSNPKPRNPNYDLDERTSRFAEQIIDFCKSLRQDLITKPIISQLVRAGTSIGANYSEADEASSKKDFINKMTIAKKEIKETKYWLRIVAYTLPETKEKVRPLWEEGHELNLIFATIVRNAKN